MTRRRAKMMQMLDRMEVQEREFLRQRFLAPVVGGQRVRVRMGGVVCTLRVEPGDFSGFGIFRPMDFVRATLDRPATLTQRRQYLQLLPAARMILCRREFGLTFAVPANPDDPRVQTNGMLIV